MKNKRKLWLLLGVVAVLLVAGGCGVWYYLGHNSSDPVYVYDFDLLGMTEYWGDSRESYGPVRTDRVQTIGLTDTQVITQILVQQGDEVRKGDLLMTFDTTLSDLALERKRLEVERIKLQLTKDEARLVELRNMRPMVIPEYDPEENQGDPIPGDYCVYPEYPSEIDGSTQDKALVCWVRNGLSISRDTVLESVRKTAQQYQAINAESAAREAWKQAVADAESSGEEAPEYVAPEVEVGSFYVVIKQTENDMSLGRAYAWQGMHVNADAASFTFFDASGNKDYSISEEGEDRPQIDMGSGYTAAQLSQMRAEQQKKIKETEFSLKMADSEYRIMLTEAQDGNVYAKFDGVVSSLLPEAEARASKQPILKVSGGGGFYIECNVSELEKDELKAGQEVTVQDYRNGGSYTGTVQSVGDYPVSMGGYYSGMENPNASRYPFTVFVGEDADLIEGNYVNVQYSLESAEAGIYLQNPFVRTENGASFVYVQGADGRLERRDVVTGKGLWGSYTEIRQGLSVDDKIAFPYGKNVKPGAATLLGDHSNLYE